MSRKEAVLQSLAALRNGQVEEAVTISSDYFGGAGTLYEKETVSIIEDILDHDFTPDPALKPEVVGPLRVAAAAMELWGTEDVREFADLSGDWTYRLKPEDVIQLLYTAGLERHRLETLRLAGVQSVTVRPWAKNLPAPCREVAGQTYPIDEVPTLPHRDPECRCRYAPGHAAPD